LSDKSISIIIWTSIFINKPHHLIFIAIFSTLFITFLRLTFFISATFITWFWFPFIAFRFRFFYLFLFRLRFFFCIFFTIIILLTLLFFVLLIVILLLVFILLFTLFFLFRFTFLLWIIFWFWSCFCWFFFIFIHFLFDYLSFIFIHLFLFTIKSLPVFSNNLANLFSIFIWILRFGIFIYLFSIKKKWICCLFISFSLCFICFFPHKMFAW